MSRLLLSAALIGSLLVAPAAAKKPPKPPPPPPPPPPSTSSTYVKSYASVIDGVNCALTPEAVQATADGGSVALALSSRPSVLASLDCMGAAWVVKADAYGTPQWQELVSCFGLADGGYFYGLSLQRTADGGYVFAGGTQSCESHPCPDSPCGLIVKLDAAGKLVWSRAYWTSIGGEDRESTITKIRQTSDGGFVAAGSFHDGSGIGAWILKLDSAGNVQWQRKLGPGGPSGPSLMHVLFNDVQPTADGGYVAAGEFTSYERRPEGDQGVLVVKFDSNGNVAWQRGFNSFDASGAPTAGEFVSSVIQSSEGGYLVAGAWGSATTPGTCCQGPLLMKLDANGHSQWQKAYSAGVHCISSGFSRRCHAIGGLAYSVHQTSDGGYSVAGAGHLKLTDSVPMVPWLAKTDASGNLVWQHFYYDVYPSTGRTLSQYFASSTLTSDGGNLALGFTENPSDLAGELFAVRTDSAGLVGACSQIHPATALTVVEPGLTAIAPALPVRTTAAAQGDLPAKTQPTAISSGGGQC